ncbi:hypothetical protein FRB95_006810 [Tulasnella sp. JGI-2019a]|nr:hypothetical protein FRB95_006810 [Tulasnella sp. JGI-2019a]
MDDYMVQALNIYLEGASRIARSQPSLNDPTLTELQRSKIMMRSFDDALKTFSDGLHRFHSAKASHHNTLLPTSHLPNELLIKIFALAFVVKSAKKLYGYAPHGQTVGTSAHGPTVHTLATLVFVCHQWRDITHNAPSLWAYIYVDYPYRAKLECLARSDQAPLHIFLNLDHTAQQEFRTSIF